MRRRILLGDGLEDGVSAANIFFVKDGNVTTPIPDCFLNGITRLTVIDLCNENGIPIEERHFNKDELMNADLGFDILYLFNGNWMRSLSRRKKVAKVGDLKVYRETVEYNPSGSCYVISKKWARELSKKMCPIKMPVDIFMGSVRVKSAKHYTLNNTRAKNDPPECWTISPLMNVFCGGGDESTQDYEAKKIKKIKCK